MTVLEGDEEGECEREKRRAVGGAWPALSALEFGSKMFHCPKRTCARTHEPK